MPRGLKVTCDHDLDPRTRVGKLDTAPFCPAHHSPVAAPHGQRRQEEGDSPLTRRNMATSLRDTQGQQT